MNRKICLITGATSGIGAATIKAIALKDVSIVAVGRNKRKCEKIVRKIKGVSGNDSAGYLITDLSSQQSIREMVERFNRRYRKLDVLINNVGARFLNRQVSADGYEMTFALNHLGPFLLTHLLLGDLKQTTNARIVNVASGAHSGCSRIDFNDLHSEKSYDGKKAYAQSKLAMIYFTYELSRRLEGTGIAVNALHPGAVFSNFSRNNGLISWCKHITAHLLARNIVGPKKGAETSVYLATSPDVEGVTGKYFIGKQPIRSSDVSYDREAARCLWEVSLQMTGLQNFKVNQ
jgi:retinol dehydrogenase-14